MILVDTNVLLDVFQNDPVWADWSQQQLDAASLVDSLLINPLVYSELSIGFRDIEDLEDTIRIAGLSFEELPREALFLAGKMFLKYRRGAGARSRVLPDFMIGAHAAVCRYPLLTRDTRHFREYFPSLQLVTPSTQ
jgi:predicted nucleic acid-binding protein